MAACPYDAIFINPEDHSAEKCNFCAHRIDMGLEPACVVVCPIEAILVGDMNDPDSQRRAHRQPRRGQRAPPREGDAAEALLQGRASGDARPARRATPRRRPLHVERADSRTPGRSTPATLRFNNSSAAALLSYDVPHSIPWDWRVSLYTWTKGIAAGAYLVAALLLVSAVLIGPNFAVSDGALPRFTRSRSGSGSRLSCPARSSPSRARCSSGTWSTRRAST